MGLGLSFYTTVLVARYLGPENFGLLAYVLSLVAIFTTAGHMGLSGLVVRDLVKYPAQRVEIVGTTIAVKTLGLGVGYIFLVTYAWFLEGAGTTQQRCLSSGSRHSFKRVMLLLRGSFPHSVGVIRRGHSLVCFDSLAAGNRGCRHTAFPLSTKSSLACPGFCVHPARLI